MDGTWCDLNGSPAPDLFQNPGGGTNVLTDELGNTKIDESGNIEVAE